MHSHRHDGPFRIGRRQLLARAGSSALAISAGALGVASLAAAGNDDDDDDDLRRAKPAPLPIPGGVDARPIGFIHWFLPGPEDRVTPFLEIPGFGLDVEPSLMTDYKGFTAFAVLAGQAKGSDGNTYNVEFDLRVMDGRYRAEDGSRQRGTFGFF